MKKNSSGALTEEQKKIQNKQYSEGHDYDYVIIGTGNAALTIGALLANAGHKICMLEAHDIPGGYAHSFKFGDFHFCAQIHYIWGCYEGGAIYEFLKKIGLEKEIKFNLYDTEGYDVMRLPDGKMVKIPMGYDKLIKNIEKAYPGQQKNVRKFCNILTKLREEMNIFSKLTLSTIPFKAFKLLNLIKYYKKTLQNVFDECNLSKEVQAVLSANAGDFMSPPKELSIMAYIYLFGGYNVGAYYPEKHYKFYIDRIAKFITDKPGCHIYYEMPVTKINTKGGKVSSVITKDKKIFTAKNFICNADPQNTAKKMIGINKFPKKYQKKLNYKYSPAGMVVYLGLKKGFDLKKYGFGKHNLWHLNQWDMNKTWKEQLKGNFDNAWFFVSTPTLHSSEPGTAPKGCQIMEIATLTDYKSFKNAQEKGGREYIKMKNELVNKMIDWVQDNYVPDLKENIILKVAGGRTTNEDFVLAPNGNAYGALLDTERVGLRTINEKTPWKNFSWCNATSGAGGFYGTIKTGLYLYMKLTKDNFLKNKAEPSDKKIIRAIRKKK